MRQPWLFNLAFLCVATAGCGSQTTGPVTPTSRKVPGPGITAMKPGEAIPEAAGQTVYVPVYPVALTQDAPREFKLTATVYVRNTDRAATLYVSSAKYFDSDGKLLREYLPTPSKVGPLAALTFFVPESDVSGGPAASMIVDWSAAEKRVSPPIVEALMIGTASNQGIAFTSAGRVIAERLR